MPGAAVSIQFNPHGNRRSSPVAAGFRQRLREATAAAHSRLDAQLGTLDLCTLPGYRRFLEVSASALLPLEAALIEADVIRLFPDWEQRSRRRALLQDLASVGGAGRPLAVPPDLGFGGVLGTMYVLEGSRLGAKVLLRTVACSHDPVVTGTSAYLCHGEGRPLWQSFLVMLEHHAAALQDETDAIDAARCAFDMFTQAAARETMPGEHRAAAGHAEWAARA